MARAERKKLITELQQARGRVLITYVTSTRGNHEVQMGDDVLRWLYEHLEGAKDEAATKGVDLLIHSNGGHGTVPWRIASLVREYAKDFAVLVPHRAFSAATLLALGANKIVMHRMGCLGPIDPSVANAFNPPNPQLPGASLPISVEDVTGYLKLVNEDVGITHDDEVIQAFKSLTEKIHPLALGNVQRSHHQSRLMASKLLRMHVDGERAHQITKIIDTLKSNLFFHGHPINRVEAKKDLGLDWVEEPPAKIEQLMWQLYLEYEKELKLTEPFQPSRELGLAQAQPSAPVLTTQAIVDEMKKLAAAGIGIGSVSEETFVKLAAEIAKALQAKPVASAKVRLEGLKGAFVESETRSDCFKTDLAIERTVVQTASGPAEGVKQEIVWHRWETEP